MTERLIQAGKLMNVPVVDHIIVGGGNGKYYSFHEWNYGLFEEPLYKEKIDKMLAERESKGNIAAKKVAESREKKPKIH